MTLFGFRIPMMASLLVWAVVWEIVGRLDLIFLHPADDRHRRGGHPIWSRPDSWQNATLITLRSFALGMALAIGVGVPLGILMGRFKSVDNLLSACGSTCSSARRCRPWCRS